MSHTIEDSQLIKLLRNLELDELIAFEKSIKPSNALSVFKYILKFKPEFKNHKLDKKYAYGKIFKKEKYNYTKITNTLSFLKRELETFLINQELRNQPFAREYLLIQNLGKRNADKFFYKKVEKLEEYLANKKEIDSWHFLKLLQLSHVKYHKSNAERLSTENILAKKAMEDLDRFFVATKLKYACELFNRKNLLQENSILSLFNFSIDEKFRNKNLTFIEVYHLVLQLTAHGTEEIFFDVKKKMIEYVHLLTKRDKYIINSYLLNFANVGIKEGDKKFIKEAFELYNFAIENEFLVIDDNITTIRFYNIIDLACTLKKLKWAENFINDWGQFIDAPNRTELINIGNARILFGQQKFDEVISLIGDVNSYDNIINEIRGRSLVIRCYFEMGESYEEFNSILCDRFYAQLRRDDNLNENTKKSAYTFIKIVRKLINYHSGYDDLKKFKEALNLIISNNPSVICKPWLIKIIDELK